MRMYPSRPCFGVVSRIESPSAKWHGLLNDESRVLACRLGGRLTSVYVEETLRADTGKWAMLWRSAAGQVWLRPEPPQDYHWLGMWREACSECRAGPTTINASMIIGIARDMM
eukprot:358407-Amphidinium_carterae.1